MAGDTPGPDSSIDIEQLADRVRRVDDRVGLELQWDLDEDDDMHCNWMLALHAIVERPGPDHSSYSTVEVARFAAEQLEERLRALRIASSGRDAELLLSRELKRRFSSRPLSIQIDGGSRYGGGGEAASWPDALPDRERVREIALTEGCRASAIARALVARIPEVTALALMIAFSESFAITLEALVPLAAWRRGALDDAALDAALPHLTRHRDDWDRVRRLREARAAGTSIAAFVREERHRAAGPVKLVMDLIDAFGMRLGDAKQFVDDCRDSRDDAALDALVPPAAGPEDPERRSCRHFLHVTSCRRLVAMPSTSARCAASRSRGLHRTMPFSSSAWRSRRSRESRGIRQCLPRSAGSWGARCGPCRGRM